MNSSFRNLKDNLDGLSHNGGQICHEVAEMATNVAQIEPAISDLRDRAATFSPPPERQGLREKVESADPREDLAKIRGRLQFVLADVDRAMASLAVRRAALIELLG